MCACVVLLTGHAHGYERTYPIYNYSLDKCGFVHGQASVAGPDATQKSLPSALSS